MAAQSRRAKPKHQRRRQPAAGAAHRRQAEFAVHKHIIERHVQQQRRPARPHQRLGAVEAGSIGIKRTVNHRRRHRQRHIKQIIAQRIQHISAVALARQIALQRLDQSHHQQHTRRAQTQAEPHALAAGFADFALLARAVLLGDHRIERGHNPQKSDEHRGKHRTAQRHRRQIVLARPPRHHGIDHAHAHRCYLRQQHRQRQRHQLAGFGTKRRRGKTVQVQKHGSNNQKTAGRTFSGSLKSRHSIKTAAKSRAS